MWISTLSSLTEAGEKHKWKEKHVIEGDEQKEECQKMMKQTRQSSLEGQPCLSWTDLELR